MAEAGHAAGGATESGAIAVRVEGRVQGVAFRAFTRKRARELGIVGTVRNLPDGAVEVHAAADSRSLDQLVEALQRGPTFARVTRIEVLPLSAPDSWATFDII